MEGKKIYSKIIGSTVKIVHSDGDFITITRGEVLDYDEHIQTLLVQTNIDGKGEGKKIYLNAKNIQKLEVLNDGN